MLITRILSTEYTSECP